MANEANISKDDLQMKIKSMLKGADLDKVTAKTVRVSLEAEYKTSFDSRKKEINEIINSILNESSESSSSSSDDDIIDDMKPIVKKIKKEEKDDSKQKVSKSSSSSSSEDDEAIARKLAEEEELGSRRKTRSGDNNKKKKPIKRKKTKDDDVKKKKSSKSGGGGYMKSLQLSPELAEFTGESEMPRHAVVKHIWDYCKENNLQDPRNKQFAICDEKLQRLVGVKRFRLFGMMKLLGKHFIPE